MVIFKGLLDLLNATFPKIETKEALLVTLDSMQPLPPEIEQVLPKLIGQLPHLLQHGSKVVSDAAASNLPVAGTGRPRAATPEMAREVLNTVNKLWDSGCTLAVAKDRAAKIHGLSRRTVARISAQRGKAPARTVTLEDLISLLSRGDADSPSERK